MTLHSCFQPASLTPHPAPLQQYWCFTNFDKDAFLLDLVHSQLSPVYRPRWSSSFGTKHLVLFIISMLLLWPSVLSTHGNLHGCQRRPCIKEIGYWKQGNTKNSKSREKSDIFNTCFQKNILSIFSHLFWEEVLQHLSSAVTGLITPNRGMTVEVAQKNKRRWQLFS